MKKRTQKFLSVLLVTVLLCSAMLATYPASAEKQDASLEEGKYYKAYAEYRIDESTYAGIVVDGTRSDMDKRFETQTGSKGSVTVQWGFSYSAKADQVGDTEIAANTLHFGVQTTNGMFLVADLKIGGETYVFGGPWYSVVTNSFDASGGGTGKVGVQTDATKATTLKKVGNNGSELSIPLSNIALEQLSGDDFVSTDFSLTLYIGSDITNPCTYSGRLALMPEATVEDGASWNTSSIDFVSSTKVLSSDGSKSESVNDGAQFAELNNTNATENGIYFYRNSIRMTADLPDMGDAKPKNNDYGHVETASLSYFFINLNRAGNIDSSYGTRMINLAMVNNHGILTMYAHSSSDAVSLGVAPNTTFDLRLDYVDITVVDVYVNGSYCGSLNNCGGNYLSGQIRRIYYAYNSGATPKAGSVTIDRWTISSYGDLGVQPPKAATLAAFKDLITVDKLLAMGKEHYTPTPYAYQTTAVDGDIYKARIIATVDADWVDNRELSAVGFYVTATYVNGDDQREGTQKDYSFQTVYTSVIAGEDTVTAPDGTYFVVCPIYGIPAEGTLTLTYQPYARLADANSTEYVEATPFTVTFANGTISK